MAHWTITLAREGAAIVVRGEGDDPHAPDWIDYEIRGNPGRVYRALLDRIKPGPWSFQADRMKDERDLYWIADCAYTEALLHPGWSVETDLPPLPEELPEEFLRRVREDPAGIQSVNRARGGTGPARCKTVNIHAVRIESNSGYGNIR